MKAKFRKHYGRAGEPQTVLVHVPVTSPEPAAGLAAVHPGRYPKHDDPEKGQRLGGICNTTRCDRSGAVMWNACTYGFYCATCARGINFRPGENVCTQVAEKPCFEEMERLYRACMARSMRVSATRRAGI